MVFLNKISLWIKLDSQTVRVNACPIDVRSCRLYLSPSTKARRICRARTKQIFTRAVREAFVYMINYLWRLCWRCCRYFVVVTKLIQQTSISSRKLLVAIYKSFDYDSNERQITGGAVFLLEFFVHSLWPVTRCVLKKRIYHNPNLDCFDKLDSSLCPSLVPIEWSVLCPNTKTVGFLCERQATVVCDLLCKGIRVYWP